MRISGVARRTRGEGPVLDRVSALAGKQVVASYEHVEPFELETEDGHRVRVDLAKSLRLEPAERRDMRWSEVEGDASLAGLRSKDAPGPHVKVRVVRSRVPEGARVELLAEDDADYIFAVTASHRRAPERRIARVTARAIATGDDAKAIIDRMVAPTTKTPAPTKKRPAAKASRLGGPRSRLPMWLTLAGGALLAIAAAMKLSPLSVDLAMGGVLLVATAALRSTLGRIPRFVSGGRKVGKLSQPDATLPVIMCLVLAGGFVATGGLMDARTPWQDPTLAGAYNASPASVFFVALFGFAALALTFVTGRTEARLVRAILAAPRLPRDGALDATWGSFDGVVRDPTPVSTEGEAVAIVHVVSEEIVDGSDPNIYTERVLSKGTFFVDGADGQSLEVHPDDAVWASTVGLRVNKKRGSKSIVDHVSAVPLRGSIVLAGRAHRSEKSKQGRVAATGVESLLFVAVREGGDARRECRAMLALRRVASVIALATVGVAIATALIAEPELPRFNIPSSD